MRLDKFLKVSRVIKRRTLAKEVCGRGQVLVNGRVAKAGLEVKEEDVLSINFGHRRVKLLILETRENVPAAEAAGLYRIIEDTGRVKTEEF
ncbi:MAG: RNA-binding S4 domain-containing protein [Eubacteriales bacterium]